ncbi:MAG: regulatory protein [Candidatus Hydrogenedentes bacterium ADurb.Bin179]|nr:MAG: regulatory protein [Candidatus Hydrogenedentes bacterium ADurb.Bin179]
MKDRLITNSATKRLHVLEAARELFLKQGFAEVAMDKIARKAGISKRTVYQICGSRNALIAATVTHDFEAWNEWFFDAVREQAKTGAAMLDAFHEVLGQCVEAPGFHGCLFARVMLSPDMADDTVRDAATACAVRLYTFFYDQIRRTSAPDTGAAARLQTVYLILLLLGGTTHRASGTLGKQLARDARTLLELLS